MATRPFFRRIEALRGLGAIAVAGYHWTGFEWIPGRSALMMFFAISGFVLCVSLKYGPQEVTSATTRFVIARAFRIYPIVLFSTLIIVSANALWANGVATRLNFETFFANATLLDVSLNSVLWALQVEVLAIPIILGLYLIERRFGTHYVALFAVVSTALSFSGGWALWPPLSRNIFAIALGMLVPTIGRDIVTTMTTRQAQLIALAAVFGLVLLGPLFGFYSQWSGVIEAYAATALISLMAYRKDIRCAAFLDLTTVRRLGRVSGSYYILHAPVGNALAMLLVLNGLETSSPLFALVALVVMFLISLITFAFVEKPGIVLGRDLISRLNLKFSSE